MSDTVPEEPIPSDPPEEGNDTVGVVPTGGPVAEGDPPPPPPPIVTPDPGPPDENYPPVDQPG